MKEKIFNIFIFIDDTETIAIEYGVCCYEVEGDDDFKRKFLISRINEDFRVSQKFKFQIKVNGELIDSYKVPLNIISNVMLFQGATLFEEAFRHFNAIKEPYIVNTYVKYGQPINSLKVPKINKNSFNALLARGIDNFTATHLILAGLNLNKLSNLNHSELKIYGINDKYIDIILKFQRPPIPDETVIKLLYESKRTCCVCRDSSKPVIIHHIEEWSQSKNHSEENLIVLCLEHHDLAHTKKELSLNLTKEQLIKFKERWITKVKFEDSKTVLGLINDRQSRWDFINIHRLFELVFELDVDYTDIRTYSELKSLNIVNSLGVLTDISSWNIESKPQTHFTDITQAILINYYLKTLLQRVIEKTPIVDITNKMSFSEIKALVKPNIYISAQLGFYFKEISQSTKEFHEIKKAYYQGNNIIIEFIFDTWYCTSSSAKFDHLNNHKIITPIIFVKNISNDNNTIIITGSCLAIGSWFDNLKIARNNSYVTEIV